MKKYIIISVIGLLFFSFAIRAQTKSFKRGFSFNNLSVKEIEALAPGASWAYNWGHGVPGNDAAMRSNGIVFIPMAWNGLNKETVRNLLRTRPEIKYILGFNEPNFRKEANLSPQQAALRWPDIEEIAKEFNLTIVGPALNYSPDAPYQDPVKWYDEFFAACPNCKVDHIALHFYMPSASAIKSSVESFKKYKKPIWLTEFCAWEDATTAGSQRGFMVETLDYLETDPDIFRYAWFKDKGWSGGHPYMQLVQENGSGELKELGEVFVNMSSYDDNFYFTTERQIPSEHYIRMNRVNIEKTTDVSGKLDLFGIFAPIAWVDYNVNIPEDGEYNIFFRVSEEFSIETEVFVSVDGKDIATKIFEKKGVNVWNTQSFKGTFSKGKQKIRVGFKKGGGLKLNWWAITKKDTPPSSIETVLSDDIKIYLGKDDNILYLKTTGKTENEVFLYNISGICVYSGKNIDNIDMSAFAQGIYIVDLRYENGSQKAKILKE